MLAFEHRKFEYAIVPTEQASDNDYYVSRLDQKVIWHRFTCLNQIMKAWKSITWSSVKLIVTSLDYRGHRKAQPGLHLTAVNVAEYVSKSLLPVH